MFAIASHWVTHRAHPRDKHLLRVDREGKIAKFVDRFSDQLAEQMQVVEHDPVVAA